MPDPVTRKAQVSDARGSVSSDVRRQSHEESVLLSRMGNPRDRRTGWEHSTKTAVFRGALSEAEVEYASKCLDKRVV